MKKFKHPLYLARWTDRFICPLPIKLNPYRGCSHQCSYCYMYKTRRIKGLSQDMVQPADVSQVERIFSEVGDGITFEEYNKDYDCPFEPQFKTKWDSGKMCKVFNDIKFNQTEKIYNRINEKQMGLV